MSIMLEAYFNSLRYKSLSRSPTFTPEAYYEIDEHCVYLHAGLLQPPFYSNDGDLSSKYGGIGWTLGHELVHGMVIYGAFYDSNGDKIPILDLVTMPSTFYGDSLCMRHQYSAYEYTGNKSKWVLPSIIAHITSSFTLQHLAIVMIENV
ncbi:hypothetical protein MN116_006866 [Schistosoma mekongi]|uniref:Peptidase M13 C-terminal domain-containing protein n=1 Tax=Schistosoma mekongi TaxID=38744 RepID=A0AAE2D3V9_SCHME|nr:hypothetical protein MN116_006866 [Schistosoma mekongi]